MNWEAIKVEISCSNVIQRDNLSFAKALDKDMMDIAKENDVTVSKRAFQSTRQRHDGHRQGERHYFTVSTVNIGVSFAKALDKNMMINIAKENDDSLR